jgi:hypothetical protein
MRKKFRLAAPEEWESGKQETGSRKLEGKKQ